MGATPFTKLSILRIALSLSAALCSVGVIAHFQAQLRPSFRSRAIPTVWIVSNRRSGTHLSMDLLAKVLQPPFRLVKTNHVYLTDSTDSKDIDNGINCECFNFLRQTGKLVHAHRDIRDVITSSFYYYQTFNPRFMANMSKEEYFANERGVRNRDISQWVNTTTPWFEQPDIFQLPFSDSLSGFRHVHKKLAAFAIGKPARFFGDDPTRIESVSNVVAKNAGKGDHGYKLAMPPRVASEILRTAREMHARKLETVVSCPPRLNPFSRAIKAVRDALLVGDGMWVGGKQKYGLYAPPYCPKILNTSKVVIALAQ